MNKKGFTLIELMVVIVIMGLIISIALVSMGESRDKAKDSLIQQNLRNLRNSAELYYTNNDTYVGVCNSDGTLADNSDFKIIEDTVNENNGNADVFCNNSDTGYATISALNNGNCWCVDWQGTSKEVQLSGSQTCDSVLSTTQCP